MLALSTVIVLVGFAYSGVIAYLVAYSTVLGVEWSVGVYFALYAVIALVGRLVVGRFQDRYGDNVIVLPILAAFALSLVLLALATDGPTIAVSGVLMGMGFGMFLPTMQAAAARLVPASGMNSAVAAVFLSIDLGVGIAPLALGTVIAGFGYSGMYLLLAAVVVAAGGLYMVTHGRGAGRNPGARSGGA